MSSLRIPDWDQLGPREHFGYRIGDINLFQITAGFPSIPDWEDRHLRAKIHERLHDDVGKLLRTSEFYSEHRLKQSKSSDNVQVEFADDVYDFQVACYQDRIVVSKLGVKMPTFHHWYHAAVPGFRQVFESVLAVMNKELLRTQIITEVNYGFRFIVYDCAEQLGNRLKNFHVLSRLVTQIPSVSGDIVGIGANTSDVSRFDYKVNLWDSDVTAGRRRLTYSVEAPSNREFTGLWFNFNFGSETYTNPLTNEREWVDPGLLLDEYGRAYKFLWDRAIGGFMKSLLSHLSFKTTASYIP